MASQARRHHEVSVGRVSNAGSVVHRKTRARHRSTAPIQRPTKVTVRARSGSPMSVTIIPPATDRSATTTVNHVTPKARSSRR